MEPSHVADPPYVDWIIALIICAYNGMGYNLAVISIGGVIPVSVDLCEQLVARQHYLFVHVSDLHSSHCLSIFPEYQVIAIVGPSDVQGLPSILIPHHYRIRRHHVMMSFHPSTILICRIG